MSYPGNNQPPQQQYWPPQQQPPYGGPQYPQYGQPPPPKKSKAGIIIAALAGAVVVVVLLIVVVLSRSGVIEGGPFAKSVPSVPLPSEFPGAVGGLYRLDDKEPGTFTAAGAKYDWVVAKYYATKPPGHLDDNTPVYVVTVYGPLGDAKDALTSRANVTAVGSGYCADGTETVPLRVCGVQRGSIVATVTDNFKDGKPSATDDELIAYAASLANSLS